MVHDIEVELATSDNELNYYCEVMAEISALDKKKISMLKTYKLKGFKKAIMKLRLDGYIVEFVETPGDYETTAELDQACYHIVLWGEEREKYNEELDKNGNKLAWGLVTFVGVFCFIAAYFLNKASTFS